MNDWNTRILEAFHTNDGTVEHFGRRLVLLHTIGARSGEPRVNPVMGLGEGDGWLVVATFSGQPVDPAWAHNLRAHPDIEIEAALPEHGIERVAVHAEELPEPERLAAWQRFLAAAPVFAEYERRTDRRFPIFRLTRATSAEGSRR